MAEVYRGYHANLDRYVAIKLLHAFLAEDDEFRERFEREARNIARLNHPNIVQVYDFDYDKKLDSYYMVMELIEGETLKDRIYELHKSGETLPLEETLRIIREAASALAYAHNRGMIHRDVKPANLMMGDEDRMVLTDFGIAKMLDAKQMTVSGGMIGTPAYMSPEQGLGEPGDDRSDIYSLGVIMYQLLTGDLPYDAETALGVILMHVNEPVPDIRTSQSAIPESVQTIVERAMTKDPETRYQDAEQMIVDIQRAEAELAGETLPEVATTARKPIQFETVETPAVSVAEPEKSSVAGGASPTGSTGWRWIFLLLFLLIAAGGSYVLAAMNGALPAVAFLASETPTATPTATLTLTPTLTATPTDPPTATPDLLASATAAAAIALSQEPTETATPTASPSPTNTPTQTETPIPTETFTPVPTNTPSEAPDFTATAAVRQTETIAACDFDYGIVAQNPEDGPEGGFFRVNEPYTREITLLNTGACAWGENTSFAFVDGEDFNAGPRIFIRESVGVGEAYTLLFEGTAPSRGSVEPTVGTWQLRTRGQIPIGQPIQISAMIFDPGT